MALANIAPGDRADGLDGDVGRDVDTADAGACPAAEQPVGGGDDGIEMRPGHRSEHQDQHGQPEHRRGAVLQQLQPGVARGELLGGDPGPDDHGDEQAGADGLGEQPPRQGDRGGVDFRHISIILDSTVVEAN